MSKNKNPLKDLDLFLKQQAASFVSPTPLSEKIQSPEPTTEPTGKIEIVELIERLDQLARTDKNALYDLIIKVAENHSKPENTMLINMALYLKGGENWKDLVREYWRKGNS